MMFNTCLVVEVYLIGLYLVRLLYKIYVSLVVKLSEVQVLKIGAKSFILTSLGISDQFSDQFLQLATNLVTDSAISN